MRKPAKSGEIKTDSNTWTKMGNGIIETLLQTKLSGREFRVILAVIRFSTGFHRTTARLGGTFLSKVTGIERATVLALVRKLATRGILTRHYDGAIGFADAFGGVVENDHDVWSKTTTQ